MRDRRHATGRLLVADDNKVNRLLLVRNLELMGHDRSKVTFVLND